MKFDDKTLIDWEQGEDFAYVAFWDNTNFGIYVAEATNNRLKEDGTKSSHIFLKIKKIIVETKNTYHYSVGDSTPGVWPDSCFESLNQLGTRYGEAVIRHYFKSDNN